MRRTKAVRNFFNRLRPWQRRLRSSGRPTSVQRQLNIQVHGGGGFCTREHDAHLYLRQATALEAVNNT